MKNTPHLLAKVLSESEQIGVDLGSHAVKVVCVHEGGGSRSVRCLAHKTIASSSKDVMVDVDEARVAEALRDIWQEHNLRNRHVRLILSDTDIAMRPLTIPRVPEAEIIKALKWQAEKVIPFPIDDCVVDYQVMDVPDSDAKSEMSILIVAATYQLVECYLNILKSAHLTASRIDVAPFAVAHAFVRSQPADSDELVPLIDLGARRTSMILMKKSELRFIRSMEPGVGAIYEEVARSMSMSREEAIKAVQEQDLRTLQADSAGKDLRHPILNAMMPPLDELLAQLDRSFAYCEQQYVLESIRRVVICGGGAAVRGMDVFLAERLGLPVSCLNPFVDGKFALNGVDKSLAEDRGPQFVAALGGAL